MSYIQVEIGGRQRGIKFSQGTNVLLQDRLGEQDESVRKAFAVAFIVWAGLKTNCVIKGERFTKTVDGVEVGADFEDVCEWVEKLDEVTSMNIVNLYTEVNPPKADQPEPVVEEKKNLMDTATQETVTNLPAES